MKIAIISTPIFKVPVRGYSGLEVIAWEKAKGLAAKGHEVTLYAPDGSECPGCKIYGLGPERQVDEKTAYSKYWQSLSEHEVIIDESWQKWSYILKAEGNLKAPVLGVMHAPVNTMYQTLPDIPYPCFVCISQDQALHFQGIFSRPAEVAYNGVDLNFYRDLKLKRTNRFLFLARFSSIKGADLAIEACKKAGVGLDLVGDTTITGEPAFFEKCKALCDGEQIKLIGPCTRSETVYWYSRNHCLLHPVKRFREPFGLAPVEAMACGMPVIAWDNGAMRETLRFRQSTTVPGGTVCGELVRSEEELVGAVVKMDKYHKELTSLKELCRFQAENFSIQNMVDRYEELCHKATTTKGW